MKEVNVKTTEDEFNHFLSYTGFGNNQLKVIDQLRIAYEHGKVAGLEEDLDVPPHREVHLKEFNYEAAVAGAPVCTRERGKVRIVCTNAEGSYPIVALLWESGAIEDSEQARNYNEFGRIYDDDTSPYDLFMETATKSTTIYCNVYPDGRVATHKSESAAIRAAAEDAVIMGKPITFEWEE